MTKNFKHHLHKKNLGNKGEKLVEGIYVERGFSVRERNYRCGRAEIDLIMERDGLLVFVEVKTRSTSNYGEPESFVSYRQEERIVEAANDYVEFVDWHGRIRFDIVAVSRISEKNYAVELFEDAFF